MRTAIARHLTAARCAEAMRVIIVCGCAAALILAGHIPSALAA